MSAKTVDVRLEDIKDGFYVRQGLDEERIILFMDLMDSGKELPPICLNRKFEIVDGRNRVHAARELRRETIKAIFTEESDELILIKMALKFNAGGALPNTKEDLRHTMSHLIEKGFSYKQIVHGMAEIFPMRMVRSIYSELISFSNRKKAQKALSIIREGNATLAEAAKAVGLPEKSLQEELDKLKEKKKDKELGQIISNDKIQIKKRTSFHNRSTGQAIKRLMSSYDAGDIGVSEVDSFMAFLQEQYAIHHNLMNDWQKRWMMKRGK